MRQRHFNYPEFISQRETRQDHSFKYVVLGIDEEFDRHFPSRYTWLTAIPGPGKRVHEAYEDTLGSKQGYLIVDTSPHGDDQDRFRSRVFPGQDPLVYRLT